MAQQKLRKELLERRHVSLQQRIYEDLRRGLICFGPPHFPKGPDVKDEDARGLERLIHGTCWYFTGFVCYTKPWLWQDANFRSSVFHPAVDGAVRPLAASPF